MKKIIFLFILFSYSSLMANPNLVVDVEDNLTNFHLEKVFSNYLDVHTDPNCSQNSNWKILSEYQSYFFNFSCSQRKTERGFSRTIRVDTKGVSFKSFYRLGSEKKIPTEFPISSIIREDFFIHQGDLLSLTYYVIDVPFKSFRKRIDPPPTEEYALERFQYANRHFFESKDDKNKTIYMITEPIYLHDNNYLSK
jgi:hypothetical protein